MSNLVTIKKIGLANSKGNFVSIDSASGGYPALGGGVKGATLCDETDKVGLETLKKYKQDFSSKNFGGKSNMYQTLNDFKIVTVTISYNF